MPLFKPLPDESCSPNFVCQSIQKSGPGNLITRTLDSLKHFEKQGEELLVNELGDLVEMLHQTALKVQKVKQKVLLAKLRRLKKEG